MPDAINHLSAFNRIAYALENMPPDDLSSLVTALEAIANKTIPVADLTSVVTAINNKAIPETDLTGVVTAINNISISGGGGVNSGSLDCDCLADVLAPLIEKIDQLVCVIVPIANSQHQIEKIINYIGMDGPHLGIDAPPGSFTFPIPGDTAPSLPYTPNPNPTPLDPETGAWVTPPVVDGVAYTYPPGGMRGITDESTYNDYKCDTATYLFRYTRAWIESINAVPTTLDAVGNSYAVVEAFLISINYLLSGPSAPQLVYSAAAGGVKLVKPGTTAGPLVFSSVMLILLMWVLVDLWALAVIIETVTTQYLAMFNARKNDLICALYKSKTVEEARSKFMAIVGENPVQASFWYDKIVNYALSDTLLSHLFACHPDFDPASIAGLGALEGGCVGCILCTDMDVMINLNLESDGNYEALLLAGQAGGLVEYPIRHNITFATGVLALCVTFSTNNVTTGGGSDVPRLNLAVIKNGVLLANTDIVVGVGITQEILLPCPVVEGVAMPFVGAVTLESYCLGTLGNFPRYKLKTLSYKEVEPA